MKKKLRLFSAIMVLILCFSLFPKAPTVSAHEIHCDPVTGKVTFKKGWPRSDDLRTYIKVNTQLAKDPQVKAYAAASARLWESYCPNEVKVDTNVPLDQSNVDFSSCTSEYWRKVVKDYASSTYAYTIYKLLDQPYMTDPDFTEFANGPYWIEKTIIYFNPDQVGTYSGNQVQKTCTHEVGHALGLGHPDRYYYSPIGSNVKSIMKQGPYEGYLVPQAHDKTDIDNKY